MTNIKSEKNKDEDNQNDKQIKSLEEAYKEIDEEELDFLELSEDEQGILNTLDKDESFQSSLEKLLANVNTLDLTQIQTELLIILKKALGTLKLDSEKLKSTLKGKERSINTHIKNLSLYIMQTRSSVIRDKSRNIGKAGDKYEYLTQKARAAIRATIKKFALYELYKFLNPKRIAGETKMQNFISNIVARGVKKAIEYSPKMKHKLSRKDFKKYTKMHKSFKQSGGRGIM